MPKEISTLAEVHALLKTGAKGTIDGRPISPELHKRQQGRPPHLHPCPAGCGKSFGVYKMRTHLPQCPKNQDPESYISQGDWFKMLREGRKTVPRTPKRRSRGW